MLARPGCIGLSSSAFRCRYSLFPGNIRLLRKAFATPKSPIWVLRTCCHSLGAWGWEFRRSYLHVCCFQEIFSYEGQKWPLQNLTYRFYAPVCTPWVHEISSAFLRQYSLYPGNIRLSNISHLGSTHMLALPGCIWLRSSAFQRRYSLFPGNIRQLGEIFASPKSPT